MGNQGGDPMKSHETGATPAWESNPTTIKADKIASTLFYGEFDVSAV